MRESTKMRTRLEPIGPWETALTKMREMSDFVGGGFQLFPGNNLLSSKQNLLGSFVNLGKNSVQLQDIFFLPWGCATPQFDSVACGVF